ncbi:hypothetical protein, partial [Sinorhizobium meliloti]|uniref:hypothetical protein n=1 Tax=Rhizobium meliloti TaxID=382 RepID=UPI001AECD3EA
LDSRGALRAAACAARYSALFAGSGVALKYIFQRAEYNLVNRLSAFPALLSMTPAGFDAFRQHSPA